MLYLANICVCVCVYLHACTYVYLCYRSLIFIDSSEVPHLRNPLASLPETVSRITLIREIISFTRAKVPSLTCSNATTTIATRRRFEIAHHAAINNEPVSIESGTETGSEKEAPVLYEKIRN